MIHYMFLIAIQIYKFCQCRNGTHKIKTKLRSNIHEDFFFEIDCNKKIVHSTTSSKKHDVRSSLEESFDKNLNKKQLIFTESKILEENNRKKSFYFLDFMKNDATRFNNFTLSSLIIYFLILIYLL